MTRYAFFPFAILFLTFLAACQLITGLGDYEGTNFGQGGSGGIGASSSTAGNGGTTTTDGGGGSGAMGGQGGSGGSGGNIGGSGGTGGSGGGNPCPDITYDDAHVIIDPVIDGSQTCSDFFGGGVCGMNMIISRNDFIAGVLGQLSAKLQGYTNPSNPTFNDIAATHSAEQAVWLGIIPEPLPANFNPTGATTSCFAQDVAVEVGLLPTVYAVVNFMAADQNVGPGVGFLTAIRYDIYGTDATTHLDFNVTVVNNTGAPPDFTMPQVAPAIDEISLRCFNSMGPTTQRQLMLVAGQADFDPANNDGLDCFVNSGTFELQLRFTTDSGAMNGQTFKLGINESTLAVRRGTPGDQSAAPLYTIQ